jgi:hypothetical protein
MTSWMQRTPHTEISRAVLFVFKKIPIPGTRWGYYVQSVLAIRDRLGDRRRHTEGRHIGFYIIEDTWENRDYAGEITIKN